MIDNWTGRMLATLAAVVAYGILLGFLMALVGARLVELFGRMGGA